MVPGVIARRYLAVVPGYLSPQTIRSNLVEDRGDGRRGSTHLPDVGKEAVTHISVQERLHGYTLLSCRLETGRTHQIRIHLSEAGHPVCGDKVYVKRPNGEVFDDKSNAPRLALHATELGFAHPATGAKLHWEMPLSRDLADFLKDLPPGVELTPEQVKQLQQMAEDISKRTEAEMQYPGHIKVIVIRETRAVEVAK